MLVLGIFACLEHLSRYARRVELLSRFAYDLACFACRRFVLSFFGMLRFVDCVCFWSFVRFSLALTIFDCQLALSSFSSQLDMLSPESIQTSGKPCPSGTHSTLSTTTSTLDVFDFATSTRTIRTPVTTETTVPTWDGNKTNQTTFLLDLWDYCKGKPDLLTFIIHGIIALPNGKTL